MDTNKREYKPPDVRSWSRRFSEILTIDDETKIGGDMIYVLVHHSELPRRCYRPSLPFSGCFVANSSARYCSGVLYVVRRIVRAR